MCHYPNDKGRRHGYVAFIILIARYRQTELKIIDKEMRNDEQ